MDGAVEGRDARVADLLEEYLAAARDGRPPDREAFLAAHADVRKELGAALTALAFVGQATEEMTSDRGSEAPLHAGTLGDFRLIREVGRGGMGVVYEAEQISLSRRVALKVLPFASVLDSRQLQRFKHEAQSAALLHHTNIVPVHAVGTERGVHYYAMEFVEGRTLSAVVQELRAARKSGSAERARERRPTPRAAATEAASSAEAQALTGGSSTDTPEYCRAVARLGVQAAEALDHAHEHGVVHRDIKPANLMLDAESRLWITDFGLARSRTNTNLTMTGAIVGTLGYMSPEQALGKHVLVDHRADIYSLGVTLIEALTLEPAFAGDDPRAVIQDIAFKNPASPRTLNAAVPPALETILLKAVAKDPEARYATAQEMADDLRRFLADEPIRARRAPVIDRVSLWAKRHKAAVAAAVCVLVVAVVALAVDVVLVGNAKRRTEDEKQRAEDALVESRNNAARADANLAKAREAVDRMLTEVGSKQLAGIPGVEPVRRKLLEEAVALYDAMLATSADDVRLRQDAARAFADVGSVYRQLGDIPAAQRSVERARSLLVALSPEDGPWNPALDELAEVEFARALVLHDAARSADAVAAFEHAVSLAERRVRESPAAAEAERRLSGVLQDQSNLLCVIGRLPEAEAAARRAVQIEEQASARAPDDRDVLVELAARRNALADVEQTAGRDAEAEECWRRAVKECESAAEKPCDSEPFIRRAEIHRQFGDLLVRSGRVEEAVRMLQVAADARARRATEFPRYPQGLVDAADSEGALAAALFQAGHAEAKDVLATALARYDRLLADAKDAPEVLARAAVNLRSLGTRLAQAGRPAEADSAYRRAVGVQHGLVDAAPKSALRKTELVETICEWCDMLPAWLSSDERLRLCREAVKVAEESTNLPDAVPECRQAHAWALGCLADRLAMGGDIDGAVDAYGQSAGIGRDLLSRDPNAPEVRRSLAQGLRNWGQCLKDAGRLDEAAPLLREALAAFEALPAGVFVDDDRAGTLKQLAELEMAKGRYAEAVSRAGSAVDVYKKVVARIPHDPRYRANLASCRQTLAEILCAADRPKEAERAWSDAVNEYRAVVRENPTALPIKDNLARCSRSYGEFLLAAGRPADAGPCFEEAVRVASDLAAADPRPGPRDTMLEIRTSWARFLLAGGRTVDAEREFRATIELIGGFGEEAALFRMRLSDTWGMLANVFSMTGRGREAVSAMERALEALPFRGDVFQNLTIQLADGPESVRDTRRAVEFARTGLDHPMVDRALLTAGTAAQQAIYDLRPGAAWNNLAFALVCDGRWTDAVAAYAKTRELGYESDGTDWIYEALAQAKLGDVKSAREICDRAVAWFDRNQQALSEARFPRRIDEVGKLVADSDRR